MSPRKVFVAVPCKHGSLRVEMVGSLVREFASLQAHGIRWMLRSQVGDSFIQRVRNCLIGMFMETDATDFFFWDDDVAAPEGAIKKFLDHPVDIVGAAYRAKTDDSIGYPMRQLNWKNSEGPFMEPDPETGLIEVDALGCGFLRFSRSAIEKMIESRKEEWFKAKGIKCWDLCDVKRLPDHGDYEGEDYNLCGTARQAGLQVWLDPNLRMMHVGEKVFEGCIWDDLQAARPVLCTPVKERVKEALKAVI